MSHVDLLQGINDNTAAHSSDIRLDNGYSAQGHETHGDLIDETLLDAVPSHLHGDLEIAGLDTSALTQELLLDDDHQGFEQSTRQPTNLLLDVDFSGQTEPCYIPYDSPATCLTNATQTTFDTSPPCGSTSLQEISPPCHNAMKSSLSNTPQLLRNEHNLSSLDSMDHMTVEQESRQLPHIDLGATTTTMAHVEHQPILLSLTDGQQIQIEPSMAIQVS